MQELDRLIEHGLDWVNLVTVGRSINRKMLNNQQKIIVSMKVAKCDDSAIGSDFYF